jgi:hypothetical protein
MCFAVTDRVDVLEKEVLNELIPYLTKELQKFASASGWPSNVVSQLSIQNDGYDLVIAYPDHLEQKIEELEYGTQSMPPRSVIRPFTNRYSREAYNRLSDIALFMFMEGEI